MINQPIAKKFTLQISLPEQRQFQKFPRQTVTLPNNSHLQKVGPELLYRNFLFLKQKADLKLVLQLQERRDIGALKS